jgi:hypothetical protein
MVSAMTGLVVMVNVAEVAFAATVTLPGTWATVALLLDRMTTTPPACAGLVRVTVPEEDVPPCSVVGVRLSEATFTADDP